VGKYNNLFRNIIAPPKRITFLVTNKCNIECDFCCFACNPRNNSFINVDDVKYFIRKAMTEFNIKYVVFSGGEPFLHNRIHELISYATKNGLGTRIVSNGFWGAAINLEDVVSTLKSSGLTELNISAGYFHQKYIPFDTSIKAALYASERGIRTLITLENKKNQPVKLKDYIIELKKIGKKYNKDYKELILTNTLAIPNNKYNEAYNSEFVQEMTLCDDLFQGLTVNFDGSLKVCCGIKNQVNNIWKTKSRSMKQFYKRITSEHLLQSIYSFGPKITLKKLIKGFFPFNHPCEFCEQIMKNISKFELIEKFSEKDFVDILRIAKEIHH